MKPGQFIRKFKTKKGNEAILRFIKIQDSKDLMSIMNEVAKERQYSTTTEIVTLKQEKEYMHKKILLLKQNKIVHIACEMNKKDIGYVNIYPEKGLETHLGEVSVFIKKKHRGEGIGTELLKEVIKQAKKHTKIKALLIGTYKTNKRACNLYKKVGFVKYGTIKKGAKIKGKYVDIIRMQYKKML